MTPTVQAVPTPGCTEDGLVQSARVDNPTLGWAMHLHYFLPLATRSKLRCSIVGGASLAGTTAFRMALISDGLFGHVGVFGSGLDRGDEANMDAWIGTRPVEQWPRVLIDSGDRDPELVSAERIAEIMARWQIPYTLNVEPG